MADIINLNRARKARAKVANKAMAGTNRISHGRTKAERDAAESERLRQSRLLDGAKRDAPQDD
ncbi:hypothetical protein BH10PSE2_BH10PSE2_18150 [soil metagenome]